MTRTRHYSKFSHADSASTRDRQRHRRNLGRRQRDHRIAIGDDVARAMAREHALLVERCERPDDASPIRARLAGEIELVERIFDARASPCGWPKRVA